MPPARTISSVGSASRSLSPSPNAVHLQPKPNSAEAPRPSAAHFNQVNDRLACITSRVLELIGETTNFNRRVLGATGSPDSGSVDEAKPPSSQSEETLTRLSWIENHLNSLEAEVHFTISAL